ncbi:MAG TPA: FecR family protein [Caulobacteraceae bacterium]|jgi:transmembrane sensor|nr:FecR family protein [Caulobacteraceae bacterium]
MANATRQAINEEAAAWFVRLQGVDVPAEDRGAFDRWMDDPAHAVAYARVEATWDRAERLKAIVNPNANRNAPLLSRRAAAIGFLTIGAGAATAWWLTHKPTYQTEIGERKTISLSDGSRVELNTASRLASAYGYGRRDVHLLAGEAMFEVAKDPKRPFVVHAGAATVRAVGTAFNVRLRDKVVEVTVTEGLVAVDDLTVRSGGRPLAAGNAAVVGLGSIAAQPLDEDALKRRTEWREGVIDLRGETLGQAVEEFNRYRTRKLVVGDPKLAVVRVGGTFETGESDKFVEALKAGFNVKVVEGDGGVVYLVPNT